MGVQRHPRSKKDLQNNQRKILPRNKMKNLLTPLKKAANNILVLFNNGVISPKEFHKRRSKLAERIDLVIGKNELCWDCVVRVWDEI